MRSLRRSCFQRPDPAPSSSPSLDLCLFPCRRCRSLLCAGRRRRCRRRHGCSCGLVRWHALSRDARRGARAEQQGSSAVRASGEATTSSSSSSPLESWGEVVHELQHLLFPSVSSCKPLACGGCDQEQEEEEEGRRCGRRLQTSARRVLYPDHDRTSNTGTMQILPERKLGQNKLIEIPGKYVFFSQYIMGSMSSLASLLNHGKDP